VSRAVRQATLDFQDCGKQAAFCRLQQQYKSLPMPTPLAIVRHQLLRLHRDEAGMEAVQTVLILAFAAVAMIAISSKWDEMLQFFRDRAMGIVNWNP
jgi:Flp pilus assembly pilin Flp